MGKIYFTTPIYYINAEPHLGHTYTTVIADTLNRYYRLSGHESFFLTGTDEHGDKVAQAAKEQGTEPKAYADRISAIFRSTWDRCGIAYDHFIRTTDAYHQDTVQKILQQIYDAGDIYFGEYGGHYCFGCERFYAERELVDGKCPDHRQAPAFIQEKNYFFRMGKYQERLIEHIRSDPGFIRPEHYRAEVLSLLGEPLEDLRHVVLGDAVAFCDLGRGDDLPLSWRDKAGGIQGIQRPRPEAGGADPQRCMVVAQTSGALFDVRF